MPPRPTQAATPPSPLVVVAVLALIGAAVVSVVLVSPAGPRDRAVATAVGLVLAGGLATVISAVRVTRSTGRRRRAWCYLFAAGSIAVLGNSAVVAVGGVDPVTEPSLVSDLSVAVALLLAVVGLLLFPSTPQRGIDQVLVVLDMFILGTAVAMTAFALVLEQIWSDLGGGTAGARALVVPLIDVALVVVALVLTRRVRGPDRTTQALLTAGFVLYAVTDLIYAVLVARGTFVFGTPLDLGWVVGYLVLALAAAMPSPAHRADVREETTTARSEAANTLLVFGVLLVAAAGQTLTAPDEIGIMQVGGWLVLVVAVAVRQTLISRDHVRLRAELECRVSERTADLRHAVRETEVLLASVADGIYGVDLEGRVTFVNPSGAAVLGYTPEQLQGRRAHDLFHAPREDGTPYPLHSCYVTEAVRQLAVTSSEDDLYLRADGSTIPVEITASPVLGEDRRVTGGVVVFRDATARREVERMKNEFLSVVSHELRTPLTSIRGALELMSAGALGELPAPATGMVRRAQQSSERLTRMINDILDLERLESGAVAITLGTCRADALLRAAAREMSGLAQAAQVEVVVEDTELGVRADFDRVVQALTNLVGNAVKFSEPGSSVVLSASAATPAPVGRSGPRSAGHGADSLDRAVVLRVADRGRGIPAEHLETVFERFEQVDSSDVRQHAGSGLGLAICRGIVEAHGGRIWADSEVGVGTTMSMTLPAERPVLGPRPPPRDRQPASAG